MYIYIYTHIYLNVHLQLLHSIFMLILRICCAKPVKCIMHAALN